MKIVFALCLLVACTCFPLSSNSTATHNQNVTMMTSEASAKFDEAEATMFAKYAAASYCCGSLGRGVEKWNCQVCKQLPLLSTSIIYDKKTNTNGYVGYDAASDSIIVVFTGTNPLSLQNWINDMTIFKTSYTVCKNCEVHEGFYGCYYAVASQVRQAVQTFRSAHPAAKLYVTGHSLGAAIAVIGSLDLQRSLGFNPTRVYTFGQPRVGNQAFATYCAQQLPQLWRVTHNRDPVPHLPPEIAGFNHNPTEVFFPEDQNSYKVCNGTGEDDSCSDQFLTDLDIFDHTSYMKFDFTTNYISCKL